MLLAGDVGGTKTLLGVFERDERRPRPILIREYSTRGYPSFARILDALIAELGEPPSIEAASVGVAGPVVARMARLTNVPWEVSAAEMAARLDTPRTSLINDLEAMAMSVEVLTAEELLALQEGRPDPKGNAVIIAAGTGLGEAYLHRIGSRATPVPSEGGHADFAARTDREYELVRVLRAQRGRAEVEDVLSGPGLLNLHRFTHGVLGCAAVPNLDSPDAAANVTRSALEEVCPACRDALAMFVAAFGAEAGNLALRGMATGGVFVGGGIAPKILPTLTQGAFMDAFRTKGAMTGLLERMPVKVILNPQAALLGAAVHAQEIAAGNLS
jgi:glucokinase